MKLATIWSQPDCGYCKKAKALLLEHGYIIVEKVLSKNYTKKDMLEEFPNARTVPQIVMDGVYVGGYSDLVFKFKIK